MVPIRSKYHTECNVYVSGRAGGGKSALFTVSQKQASFLNRSEKNGYNVLPSQTADSLERVSARQTVNTYGGLGQQENTKTLCMCAHAVGVL